MHLTMLWLIWNLFVRYLTQGSLSNDNGDGYENVI